MLRWHLRPAPADQGYSNGAVAVSLFLTNERSFEGRSAEDRDRASAYQVQLDVGCSAGFLERRDPRAADLAINANDWDHRVNNLHYRGNHVFAVGHNIDRLGTHLRGGVSARPLLRQHRSRRDRRRPADRREAAPRAHGAPLTVIPYPQARFGPSAPEPVKPEPASIESR